MMPSLFSGVEDEHGGRHRLEGRQRTVILVYQPFCHADTQIVRFIAPTQCISLWKKSTGAGDTQSKTDHYHIIYL